MSSKWSYIWGSVTIIVIVGGTIYAIKKAKDAEALEEEEITLEEARHIVARGKKKEELDMHEIIDEARDYASFNASFAPPKNDEEHDEDDIDEMLDNAHDFINSVIPNKNEEAEELRYDPNSREALTQFIKMELSEWGVLEETYGLMERLFDFPFQPQNDGDEVLRTQMIDYRVQFFSFNSKWVQNITFADLILHYARAAEFNCGHTIKYWVEYFLGFVELDIIMSTFDIDDILEKLNNHVYYNEERNTYGLFGLTENSMEQAIRIADRNVDRSVTYQIEFNEFLKSIV